jgi:hypothetical protein
MRTGAIPRLLSSTPYLTGMPSGNLSNLQNVNNLCTYWQRHQTMTDKRQTRLLVTEGARIGRDRNFQTVKNFWSWVPDGARHQDIMTDWLTDNVLCLVTSCTVSCSADFRQRIWRSYAPPKRRFIYGLHGGISQNMAKSITTAVRTLYSLYWRHCLQLFGSGFYSVN